MSQQQGLTILVNWSKPFDEQRLQALDHVVNYMYAGGPQEKMDANNLLNEFKGNPDAWLVVDTILEKSQSPHSKFLALQILDEAVNTRWKILPREQKTGIRNCIISLVLRMAEDEQTLGQNQHLLTKLNTTLVSIVKQEWMVSWDDFISDICNTAQQSQAKCENVLNILKLLSEEVFDFSKTTLLQSQAKQLKETMLTEFSSIFELCQFVINEAIRNPESIKQTLIRQCLKTLQAFLSWIPLGYIFQTELVEQVLRNLIGPPSTRIEAIKLFTEISQVDLKDEEEAYRIMYKEKICMFYCIFIEQIAHVTKNRDFRDEYETLKKTKSQVHFENFAKQVCIAITSVFTQNLTLIETSCNTMEPNQNIDILKQYTSKGLEYLNQCSNIAEEELFKITLDFWHFFTLDNLQKSKPQLYSPQDQQVKGMNLNFAAQAKLMNNSFMHSQVYPHIFQLLRETMVDNMAKPKEVLVVVDEHGEAVQEHFDDVETIHIYELMRETLVYLTNIDQSGMDRCIQNRLDGLTKNKENFSFEHLNKLCWALGSISGCMSGDDENKFVVSVVKELLNLCEKTNGKSNKALVASDIMYVVGQFPKFLTGHWPFLKTVIKKLNEFMHEKHPGVQDMASETFLKISKLTKHMFTIVNEPSQQPYVLDLISMIPDNGKDLEAHQKLMIYEGIGYMVSTEQNQQRQNEYILKLMQYAHAQWQQILERAQQNINDLMAPECVKEIDHIIKINQRVAQSIGQSYLVYLSQIFQPLIQVYKQYSQWISESVRQGGISENMIRPMKTLRRDILTLIQTYIEHENHFEYFNQNFLPTLQAMVEDYQNCNENARDPQTLMLFAVMLKSEGELLAGYLKQILFGLCQPTLEMIKNDFISFPEFREGFFMLVHNIIKNCTPGMIELEPQQFLTIIQTVIFAMKHEKPEVMEIGLKSMQELHDSIAMFPQVSHLFYVSYFTQIITEVLFVMTDCRHLSGFKQQCQIFKQLIGVIDQNSISQPVQDIHGKAHTFPTNKEYLTDLLLNQILEKFANLNKVEVEKYIIQLFNNLDDWKQFKGSLRDLMISMRSFSSQENEIYEHEKKVELEKAAKKAQERKSLIPGIDKRSQHPTVRH